MKFALLTTVFTALCAPSILAVPLEARNTTSIAPNTNRSTTRVTDVDVLQFALTLEHLESVFYRQGLSRFTRADFIRAGFPASFFNQLQFVARDEASHVVFLQRALTGLGVRPVSACRYNFPFTDVRSFVGLASVLEGIGVSAYLGGAPLISNKGFLGAAGAILAAEGVHQSLFRNSLNLIASANIAGTAINPNAIFSLASAFIVSCPRGNPALPFTAFPSLSPRGGSLFGVNTLSRFVIGRGIVIPPVFFITFVSGFDIISIPGVFSGGFYSGRIPRQISGQSFVFLTRTAARGTLVESTILAGPAIIEVNPTIPNLNLLI
ncbi:uncharacterized protein CIMG_01021 [Coccidioides immitis RS]|uniref:Uncharacterized protein n=1 Tax=Coccidioides immitis (strain RS) TaxID=246410 RepID=A0A0E1RYB7_COCIM|nr:uncharacterized protein CIMG_01021 [Coccidioides immitis RS]EAS35667.1 hypothetical protein CIMG_01021 [Coccidioides immitis RS]TPX26110.1 hypothetical protein DIZ76_011569 [Coccidioides immitis]